jgi:hypothetical protein
MPAPPTRQPHARAPHAPYTSPPEASEDAEILRVDLAPVSRQRQVSRQQLPVPQQELLQVGAAHLLPLQQQLDIHRQAAVLGPQDRLEGLRAGQGAGV